MTVLHTWKKVFPLYSLEKSFFLYTFLGLFATLEKRGQLLPWKCLRCELENNNLGFINESWKKRSVLMQYIYRNWIFPILQFEISSLMNWIFSPKNLSVSSKTLWSVLCLLLLWSIYRVRAPFSFLLFSGSSPCAGFETHKKSTQPTVSPQIIFAKTILFLFWKSKLHST